MNRIASIKEVHIYHRKPKGRRMLNANLAVPASVAMANGRRPASAYHRIANSDAKMRTCAGECVNRICIDCKMECSECQKDVCADCAFSQEPALHDVCCWQPQSSEIRCHQCVQKTNFPQLWHSIGKMPECCFIPHQQHAARWPVQRNPVARCIDFD